MRSRKLRFWLQIFSAGFAIFLAAFSAPAQNDPDPNSPTPVLMSEADSTRALATEAVKTWRGELPKPLTKAFGLNQRIVLFVTNVNLMDDEGANAFRVYAEDSKGRPYRFPVLELRQAKSMETVYALTIQLTDELGFWGQPEADGDILIGVTWRGLASNRLRLGLGKVGGEIKGDQPGDLPIPEKSATKNGDDESSLAYVGYRWSGDRIRFLEQATFGPTQALDDRLRRIGLRTWLAEQFEAPYPSAAFPYPNIPLKALDPAVATGAGCGHLTGQEATVCIRDHYSMYPLQTWNYKMAFYGDAQLRHRVAWSLSQIWVIAAPDTQQSSWMIEYHQQLNKSAFGNWRTLMEDITLNPGMGNYLDMMRSTRTNPNENYAREVLQLFNVGLYMLNQDGTVQTDGQGVPIPSYDQNIVNNFTKVFTGWRDCRPADFQAQCPDASVNGPDYKDPMSLNTNNHDLTAKTLFNYPGSTTTNIAACGNCTTQTNTYNYAYASLDQALDNIYGHPNVAPFVSKLLIQHLVTSDPTPAYVGRVSAVFTANKTNPTQMKEVIKAILLDPEARGDIKTDPRYGKLREPVNFMTNLYRHFNVASFDGLSQSDGDVDRFAISMAQRSFYSPTVFNYYPADFTVPGTTLLAPEFGIYTTGTSIARANAVNSIVFGRIAVSLPNTPNGTSINMTEFQNLAAADASGNMLMDALNQKMMHGAMSASMRSTILTAVLAAPSSNPLLRAQTAIYLIATSSQYQVQR